MCIRDSRILVNALHAPERAIIAVAKHAAHERRGAGVVVVAAGRGLGVDGFCTDCSGSYNFYSEKPGQCPRGMLQQHGNSQLSLAKIIDKAREQQPQIAMGGEQ